MSTDITGPEANSSRLLARCQTAPPLSFSVNRFLLRLSTDRQTDWLRRKKDICIFVRNGRMDSIAIPNPITLSHCQLHLFLVSIPSFDHFGQFCSFLLMVQEKTALQ